LFGQVAAQVALRQQVLEERLHLRGLALAVTQRDHGKRKHLFPVQPDWRVFNGQRRCAMDRADDLGAIKNIQSNRPLPRNDLDVFCRATNSGPGKSSTVCN